MENKFAMIEIDECLNIISKLTPKRNIEKITIHDSFGRILAKDIIADIDQPPFNKSAMDGYACRMQDLPGPLTITGTIAAGSISDQIITTSTCMRIFTGAPVPDGADCVIMQEYTESDANGNIIFNLKTKNNICLRGEDIKAGDVAITAGTLVQPHHIGIMSGFGITKPEVFEKIKVAVICSGSELIEPEQKPQNAMIRNSNAYQLIAQISQCGAEASYLGIVKDSQKELTKSLDAAIGKYDILIVTGGASVGDYDFMPTVLNSLKANVHFSSLNIQPGKPVLCATIEQTHILGLSGNPVSSFLQFLLVAKPLIKQLSGSKSISHNIVRVPITENIKRKKGNRQLYVPVSITADGTACPVYFNGSAHLTALTNCNGFAILEPAINEITIDELAHILII